MFVSVYLGWDVSESGLSEKDCKELSWYVDESVSLVKNN